MKPSFRQTRREFVASLTAGGLLASGCITSPAIPRSTRLPNILWLISEDTGPDFGCYGDRTVPTPNLDRLAAQGTRFTHAFSTAPVCSATRSAFHTGMYQTAIGAHHHRSHRSDGYRLPDNVKLISEHLRDAGYYTSNASIQPDGSFKPGKLDLNFSVDKPFDGVDWRERPASSPFFAVINFFESHRGFPWEKVRKEGFNRTLPARVNVPPYYPDTDLVRGDIATYYEVVGMLDERIGTILERLEADGLAENTIVFYFGDHGRCWVRGKQWLYDSGLHVPLMIRWPNQIKGGSVRRDLASLIDVSVTTLWAAVVDIPPSMQGHPLLGPVRQERDYIFAARDRCDETMDRIRCTRDHRYKYIRNYMPERPYTQPNRYMESSYPVLGELKSMAAAGPPLTPAQMLFLQTRKPAEELYDLFNDPNEVANLATNPAYAGELKRLRAKLDQWLKATQDQGFSPEKPEAVINEYKSK